MEDYYKGDECSCTKEEAKLLIGKVIKSIISYEYKLTITFTDDSEIEVSGSTSGDCSLGFEYIANKLTVEDK